VAQTVEHLSTEYEILSSNPVPPKEYFGKNIIHLRWGNFCVIPNRTEKCLIGDWIFPKNFNMRFWKIQKWRTTQWPTAHITNSVQQCTLYCVCIATGLALCHHLGAVITCEGTFSIKGWNSMLVGNLEERCICSLAISLQRYRFRLV
jgi:hypothetical protein